MRPRPSPTLANAVAPGVRVAHIEPLQRRIERNRLRFVAFMVLFTTAVALGFAVTATVAYLFVALLLFGEVDRFVHFSDGAAATLLLIVPVAAFAIGLFGSLGWALVQLSRSETVLIRRLDARMPKGGTLLATKGVLRDIAIAAGLPKTPPFYVIDTSKVNAFVVGRTPDRARIGVTRGMLEKIPVDEQRAVFANLMARVLSGDTLWATAVSAIMGPIWAVREHDLRQDHTRVDEIVRSDAGAATGGRGDWRLAVLVFYGALVVVTELFAWYHCEAAWKAAEKADAEGMMLLKDPRSMLRAIERVLERDNFVPTAGDAYSQLFFCWAGFGFAPEDDPEMRRVARLRETLGAEGAAYVPRPNVPGWPIAPPPPRLGHADDAETHGGS
ncbi:MAG: M48 family metalloprotease [Coriobacteriia bacterium]|nr:M48 family metalloprotease [Coriobacteriia bacterium]